MGVYVCLKNQWDHVFEHMVKLIQIIDNYRRVLQYKRLKLEE